MSSRFTLWAAMQTQTAPWRQALQSRFAPWRAVVSGQRSTRHGTWIQAALQRSCTSSASVGLEVRRLRQDAYAFCFTMVAVFLRLACSGWCASLRQSCTLLHTVEALTKGSVMSGVNVLQLLHPAIVFTYSSEQPVMTGFHSDRLFVQFHVHSCNKSPAACRCSVATVTLDNCRSDRSSKLQLFRTAARCNVWLLSLQTFKTSTRPCIWGLAGYSASLA